MPLPKSILPGTLSPNPLLKMLRKSKEIRTGGLGLGASTSTRTSTPQAALSVENISAGSARRSLGLFQWYNEQLALRPLQTKAWTCFVGSVLGDAIAQYATDMPFDVIRNLRLSMYGLLVGGPSGHYWHALLDSQIMPSRPQSPAAVLLKLAADQLLFAPLATAIFMAYLKCAEGLPTEAIPFVQGTLWSLLLANWMVWPIANLFAFGCVPRDYRILYSNIIGVAWCTYMSVAVNAPPKIALPLEDE